MPMNLDAVDQRFIESDYEANWELFHENSKTSFVQLHHLYKVWPSEQTIVAGMKLMRRVKPYTDLRKVALPAELPASTRSFDDVVRTRQGARAFGAANITLPQLAKVLAMSYGVNRDNAGTSFPRPFRTIPSGGALYPLELYVLASRVAGLPAGLYHFDPEDHALDVLREGDELPLASSHLVQRDLGASAAAIVFISAVFARSTFKYGDRGYRFILLEAGHLAQNANLTAQEMGLATTNVGGYADRAVDRYLGFDGVNESTIYLLLLGAPE
jgi:SagB-type dehydrogenase family enzyme